MMIGVARFRNLWYNTGDGSVAEWFKAHAWKACVRGNRTGGSNPLASAI